MRTTIKSYGDEATDFHDKEIPKVGSYRTYLEVINLDSSIKKDENYYPQMFLKEFKYTEKKESLGVLLTTKEILPLK